METIVLRLDPRTRARLELICRITGEPGSSLVARAVQVLVDAETDELLRQGRLDRGQLDAADRGQLGGSWNIVV